MLELVPLAYSLPTGRGRKPVAVAGLELFRVEGAKVRRSSSCSVVVEEGRMVTDLKATAIFGVEGRGDALLLGGVYSSGLGLHSETGWYSCWADCRVLYVRAQKR